MIWAQPWWGTAWLHLECQQGEPVMSSEQGGRRGDTANNLTIGDMDLKGRRATQATSSDRCTGVEVPSFQSARAFAFEPMLACLAQLQASTIHRDTTKTATMLPDEIIAQLNSEFQCREYQVQQLTALYAVRQAPAFVTNPTDTLRRISHQHRFSTSTASLRPAKPHFFDPTSISLVLRTQPSMFGSASPRDTSWSAW
jgi:hypothetical protein